MDSARLTSNGTIPVRTSEAAKLTDALDQLATGTGGLIALAGDPGSGKTRLVVEMCWQARESGIRVVHGRSAAHDQQSPLSPLLGTVGPGQIRSPVSELYRSLNELSSTTTLVVLDDFHHADHDSIELVEYLTRHPLDGPLLIVLCYRPRQAGAMLRSALAKGCESGSTLRMPLPSLTVQQSAALTGLTGCELTTLHAAGEGIPQYLLLLASSIRENPVVDLAPSSHFDDLVAGETSALTAPAAALLRAASILGSTFSITSAAAILEQRIEITPAQDELLDHDLIRPTPEPTVFRFRHDVVRTAIYRQVRPTHRRKLHRSASVVLSGSAEAPTLARHLEIAASRCTSGLETFNDAAQQVIGERPDEAIRWLRIAADVAVPGDQSVHQNLLLARALVTQGDLTGAARLLTVQRGVATDRRRPQIVTDLALVKCFLEEDVAATTDLQVEINRPSRHRPGDKIRMIARLAIIGMFDGELPGLDLIDDLAGTGADDEWSMTNVDELAMVGLSALSAAYHGDFTTAVDNTRRGTELAILSTDDELAEYPDYLTILGWSEIMTAKFDLAIAHFERQLSILQTQGLTCMTPVLLIGLSTAYHCKALVDTAERTATAAKDAARALGAGRVAEVAEVLEYSYLSWSDRADGSSVSVQSAEKAMGAPKLGGWWFGTNAALQLASALKMHGDADRCAAVILATGGGPELSFISPSMRPWCYETLADVDADRGDSATADWVQRAQDAAAGSGAAGHAHAYAVFAAAHLARMQERYREAAELYRQGAQSFAALGMRGPQIRALNEAGALAVAAGHGGGGTQELRAARELAHQAGKSVVYENTESTRRKVVPISRESVDTSALASLTKREAEIAQITATGMRTRAIADLLHLSPRTVDIHLTHIYRKLGINNRAQLVRLMVEAA
ncbi:DNA-binding CsgD family transcriptional regulator [Rhodococcus sp. 27YEA15]|uniref:helix-turn-helix transcriptional regulator n=1 Tax=Rhodococcus sp. 27YEA15 TaxID=3156259 RepID=UPI003C7CDA27